ncbi:MAG: hypothetical protein GEU87_07555 [Alphaproteobacteria bacterium]|nr:hypothetical protein [Alphaproteobacteria bacterium]
MRWRKLGRIFKSAGQRPWMWSHSLLPFAELIEGNLFRIWFTSRDANNRSHVVWLETDLTNPQNILRIAEQPVLAPGAPECFDHTGVGSPWLVRRDDEHWLYYIGWSQHGPDPYHVAIGLAISQDNGKTYVRHSGDPVLDRNPSDPTMVSTPCVLGSEGNWSMWYFSVTEWPDLSQPPHYNIRRATSSDGIVWQTNPNVVITTEHPTEVAIARPSVIRKKDGWRMWFCHRGTDYPYRIGYAESLDGLTWTRLDARAGIEVSDAGWDSEMIAYPFVFDHAGERYMLYAGNGYGRAGMGLAVLERD